MVIFSDPEPLEITETPSNPEDPIRPMEDPQQKEFNEHHLNLHIICSCETRNALTIKILDLVSTELSIVLEDIDRKEANLMATFQAATMQSRPRKAIKNKKPKKGSFSYKHIKIPVPSGSDEEAVKEKLQNTLKLFPDAKVFTAQVIDTLTPHQTDTVENEGDSALLTTYTLT